MTELKAFACMEPYEMTGGIIFAKSNIEARKWSANEWHDGEIAGMSVKRAPWADKYGSRSKIPIADMVDHGWHFECMWSGLKIDSDLYQEPQEIYNPETKEWEEDNFLVGKSPVGFQEGWCFACQEYSDLYREKERKHKAFDVEWINFFKSFIMKRLPDATLIDDGTKWGDAPYIYSVDSEAKDFWVIQQLRIPFSFPGGQNRAELKYERDYGFKSLIGPTQPKFYCSGVDRELFEQWAREQKEKID